MGGGRDPALFGVIAHRPDLLKSITPVFRAIFGTGTVPPVSQRSDADPGRTEGRGVSAVEPDALSEHWLADFAGDTRVGAGSPRVPSRGPW